MTREEAIKFLSNTKVYVNGKSKEIQEKLFSLGFQWEYEGQQVLDTEKPFLFIWKDMNICHCNDMEYFTNNKTFREITVSDILSIVIDELKYRPFRFAKECFDEMRKHEPFGWIHDDYKYIQVVGVFKDKIEFTPFERNDEDGLESFIMTFSEVLNKGYKFVDGKPFGIKVN